MDRPRPAGAGPGSGYAVVDQTSVLATHLAEIIRQNAHELLTRQETKRLLDAGESHPKLVEELVPKLMTLGEVQKVLQQLLREQVSIRDLARFWKPWSILRRSTRIRCCWWKRRARRWDARWCGRCWTSEGELKVVTLDPRWKKNSRARSSRRCRRRRCRCSPRSCGACSKACSGWSGDSSALATRFCCAPSPARFHLRRLLEPFLPQVVVLSPAEIPPLVPVQSMGVVQ